MQRSIVVSSALLVCVLTGCQRVPVNAACHWPSEAPISLDLDKPEAMRHLTADVQLAEELAIRFADSEHGRRTGFSGHGGLLENGRVVSGCRAILFDMIASTHRVPMEQVLASRTARPRGFDTAVFLAFAAVYAFLVWVAVPIVLRRFLPDGRWPTLAALLFVSLVAAATGLLLGEMWAVGMEMVRLGNDHLGQLRGLRIPWVQHRTIILGVGLGLFWLLATVRLWVANRRGHDMAAASHAV